MSRVLKSKTHEKELANTFPSNNAVSQVFKSAIIIETNSLTDILKHFNHKAQHQFENFQFLKGP